PEEAKDTAADDHQALLAKKDLEISELKDLYRRALADAENVRTRTQKEIKDKTDYAIQSFAKDLLSTADILAMALNAVPEQERGDNATHKELKNLYVGVMLTQKELLKTFSNYGVEGYDPLGEKFDFNLHTAIFQSAVPGKEPGTIFHVDKIGYKIKDRILRPANVGVVKDPEN
ncbi:Mitochondrial matrix cochaperone, partial [Kappamyces sp. JEL0680]